MMELDEKAWTLLADDGNRITSPMPADGTVVDVLTRDGLIRRAFYSCNLMEAGDWDFAPVNENDDVTDGDSLDVVGWRALAGEKP